MTSESGRLPNSCPRLPTWHELPSSPPAARLIYGTRHEIADLLHGKDDRLLVVVGPCSIHDTKAALEYADRLLPMRQKYQDSLVDVACLFRKTTHDRGLERG